MALPAHHDLAWSLAIGYGLATAVQALRARRSQVQGVHEGTIAGMAASAWFLANPQFLEGLPSDHLSLLAISTALLLLVHDDWGISSNMIGGRFFSSGADDGFA